MLGLSALFNRLTRCGIVMDRDRRLTGFLRGQTDNVKAPEGFELSNPWRVCLLFLHCVKSAVVYNWHLDTDILNRLSRMLDEDAETLDLHLDLD